MSRSPKIPKELILQSSLNLLIKEGYSAVTIKNIANELNCSTQPISWHFGNMNGLKSALLERALQYVSETYSINVSNALLSFCLTGKSHIDMALNSPNLFRFLYLGESGMQINNLSFTVQYFNTVNPAADIAGIANALNIDNDKALFFTQTMLLYTHGLCSMIATHSLLDSSETIYNMFLNTTLQLFRLLNISDEIFSPLMNKLSSLTFPN